MKTLRYWPAALFVLAVSLAGCSGNHKFNDAEYRPLGDPQSSRRDD
ncbi:MAG: type VI secretion protein [Pseudomonas sp.]